LRLDGEKPDQDARRNWPAIEPNENRDQDRDSRNNARSSRSSAGGHDLASQSMKTRSGRCAVATDCSVIAAGMPENCLRTGNISQESGDFRL
jgi:hypothetical protein